MKSVFSLMMVIASIGFITPRLLADAPAAPADLVQQVQAADLLADLITYTVDRADAQLKDAQGYLEKVGKLQAYERARPMPPMPRPLNYMLLFRGSLAFVEGDGAKYADSSVNGEPASALYEDLTAAQYYNMHEFLHFNEQRRAFASIQAYLQSIGQWGQFLASTGETATAENVGVGSAATQPVPTTPQEVAARMGDLIHFIKETAWKAAQAKGTGRDDFDKQWSERVKQYRQRVMAGIEEAQPIEGGFGKAEVVGANPPPAPAPAETTAAPTPPQVIYVTQQEDIGANHQLPPPVESPYSNSLYRGRDLSLWGMWDFNRHF